MKLLTIRRSGLVSSDLPPTMKVHGIGFYAPLYTIATVEHTEGQELPTGWTITRVAKELEFAKRCVAAENGKLVAHWNR